MLRLSWLSPLRNRLASVRKLPAAPFSKPAWCRGAELSRGGDFRSPRDVERNG